MPANMCPNHPDRPVKARGLCAMCDYRLTTGCTPRRLPVEEAFWRHVAVAGEAECWLWTGPVDRGYGAFHHDGRKMRAHRWGYEHLVGPIPEGLVLDHVKARGCSSTLCVNPAHLEPVTDAVNVLRGEGITATNARKTHCKSGHEFTPENTIQNKASHRVCRACYNGWARDWYRRKTQHSDSFGVV